ncbi:matrix protein [Actinidia cytorhabdovirus JS27]|uniref:Matrix protein n=1 Tax=Actinidia virus D TaxID=3069721 RepID=A0A8E6YJ35_9RHAB|nr:matrix protein [Actinidia cytorhabdovirus JS27]QVU21446.1 matrix protein [Actinidia virus D]
MADNMSSIDVKWYKVRFETFDWHYEYKPSEKNLLAEPRSKNDGMARGFLQSKIRAIDESAAKLITALIDGGHVRTVQTVSRSMYLGAGCKKCSYILPKCIIVPTDIPLPLGPKSIPRTQQIIKVNGLPFYMSISGTWKVATMSVDDATVLFDTSPKDFIGMLTDPFPKSEIKSTIPPTAAKPPGTDVIKP